MDGLVQKYEKTVFIKLIQKFIGSEIQGVSCKKNIVFYYSFILKKIRARLFCVFYCSWGSPSLVRVSKIVSKMSFLLISQIFFFRFN